MARRQRSKSIAEDESTHHGFRQLRDWQRKLNEGGWAAVHWPVEYGGRGATLVESAIFFEELTRAHLPLPVNELGLAMGGPTVMAHGTPEQKERFIRPIISADEIWCRGLLRPAPAPASLHFDAAGAPRRSTAVG